MQLAQPVLRLPHASAWGARGGSPLRRRGGFWGSHPRFFFQYKDTKAIDV